MATIGSLFVNINARTDNFEQGMNRTRNSANGLNGVFGNIKKTIAGFLVYDLGKTLVGGLVSATKAGINYNAMLQSSKISWKALLDGSEKGAKSTIKMLENLAAVTPFDFEGVDKFAKKLTIAGLGGKDLEKNIVAVGDAVTAMGGGTEELNGVATALSQMSMKGKISAEEMQQLAERGIPAYKLLAESMGVSEATLMDMMKDGEVMSKEALPLLIGQMDKAFGGSMKKNVGSFNANVSTLKDTFRGVMGQLSKPLFDKLNQGMNNIIPMLMKFKDALSGEGGFMGAIKKFAPGIMPFVQLAISIFKSMGDTVGVIIKSMTGFWNEHKGWLMPVITFLFTFIAAIVTNTITAIGAVVQSGLAVVDGIINFFQNLFKGNFSGCWESIKQIFFGALEFVWNLMQVQFALNIPAMIKGFGKGAIGIFKGMWSSVKGFFSGGIKGCLGFVKNLLSGAKSSFGTLKAFGANSFQALWSIAKSMMSRLLSSVISNIRQVPTNIKNFMTQAVGVLKGINLFSIGSSMIKGLINGITNAAGGVVKAVTGAVGGAIEAAKKKLKINSPSKVFMAIGASTGEGLVKGIENENKNVAKASSNLSKSVIGGYNAKLKGLSGSFKSDTANNNKNVNINVQNMNVVDKGDKNRTLSQLSFLATV